MDDAVIRNKIQEANQLIDRVKKALDKMKTARRSQEARAVGGATNSSGTDIEETIKKLKMETNLLITAGDDESTKQAKTKSGSRENIKRNSLTERRPHSSTRTSLNKTFVKQPTEDLPSGSSEDSNRDSPVPKNIPKPKPCFDKDLERARKRSFENVNGSSCCKNLEMLDYERPKTRRNEADDDLTEPRRLDKFRSCPEDGQVTSSLEELQAKLQTISESTESSFSTPRNKKSDDKGVVVRDAKCCGCNTDKVQNETKEVQVCPDRQSIGIAFTVPSENKCVQTTPERRTSLSTTNFEVASLLPQPKQLEATNLNVQEVPTKRIECGKCRLENLPVHEIFPKNERLVCEKCKKLLQEEQIGGISIPPKLRNLTVQILPPIIIKQNMVVERVLNFYISPEGVTQNFLPETENRTFLTAKKSSDSVDNSRYNKNMVSWVGYIHEADDCLPLQDENRWEDNDDEKLERDVDLMAHDNSDQPDSRTSAFESHAPKSIDSKFFLKLRDDVVKNLDFADELASRNDELDEQDMEKLFVYKSYNLYDNPNRHDPGGLDQESCERISGIDLNFYKTFINPSGMVLDRDTPYRSKGTLVPGFDIKEVQCDSESLALAAEAIGVTRETISGRESLFQRQPSSKKLKPSESKTLRIVPQRMVKQISNEMKRMSDMRKEAESEVTVFKLRGMEYPDPSPSMVPHITSKSSEELDYTTPSEITVTISYSEISGEGSINSRDPKNSYESRESKFKPTTIDSESRTILKSTILKKDSSVRQQDVDKETGPKTNEDDSRRAIKQNSSFIDINPEPMADSKEPEHKVILTREDKMVINKLHQKFKSVDTDASDPVMKLKKPNKSAHETVHSFIKGLTRISANVSDTEAADGTDATEITSDDSQNSPPKLDVNYHLINADFHSDLKSPDNLMTEPLALASNGRYKDEENLFTQSVSHYMQPVKHNEARTVSPTRDRNITEVGKSKLKDFPRHTLNRYSPNTTNSDTVTTNSGSGIELYCKHSVSSAGIQNCNRKNHQCIRNQRTIQPRSNLTKPSSIPHYSSTSNQRNNPLLLNSATTSRAPNQDTARPGSFSHNKKTGPSTNNRRNSSNKKHFSLTDPKVTIERRRNYFNNWVTYYVKTQEINPSSTSSCTTDNK